MRPAPSGEFLRGSWHSFPEDSEASILDPGLLVDSTSLYNRSNDLTSEAAWENWRSLNPKQSSGLKEPSGDYLAGGYNPWKWRAPSPV